MARAARSARGKAPCGSPRRTAAPTSCWSPAAATASGRAASPSSRLSPTLRCSSPEENAMPLVRISMLKGKPASYRHKVGDAIHQAMMETIDVPAKDRFQVITEHDPEDLIFDREYLGIARSRDII